MVDVSLAILFIYIAVTIIISIIATKAPRGRARKFWLEGLRRSGIEIEILYDPIE